MHGLMKRWEKEGIMDSHLQEHHPLDWKSSCHGEGASHQKVSNQVSQQELVGASLLHPIKTNRSYVNAKDLIQCWRN